MNIIYIQVTIKNNADQQDLLNIIGERKQHQNKRPKMEQKKHREIKE